MSATTKPQPPVLSLYRRLARRPFGRRLFSLAVSWKAPYFRSIGAVFVDLAPGRGEVAARNRWRVHNHIGTFHAIACCNLAELAAGTTIEVSVPASHRWIPKGMTVSYLAKAETDLRAVAVVEDLTGLAADESREVVVPVDVIDTRGTTVVHADITMWVTPRRREAVVDAPAAGPRA
ncbi:acyl-coenzyme A thioesterase PaaI-like protein [Krasilnikovia cinnamomea]|uniref:Acyl-coenzyme A thioesterase PaaI-like protein n=1 Tax=Krasilnikovia cinnamomea TaxID=349313 RepID=A0A4Q7ZUA6_9ACTN|nr:hotdog fold domain-containing protein [Krasilnikovia cinnamomea]RZU54203.1 acyl-coenzyme A thioesterase PaaI-like protein [Krasilnikovia cinnamomea]